MSDTARAVELLLDEARAESSAPGQWPAPTSMGDMSRFPTVIGARGRFG
jgi:hypothetical protein